MKSQGVLRRVIQAGNAKQIAADLGSSPSILYKWTEEGESGRRNPLDRIVAIYHSTGDRRPVEWLCQQAGGSFVENPPPKPSAPDLPTAAAQAQVELTVLLQLLVRLTIQKFVGGPDALRLRQSWEQTKTKLEGFVRACEKGTYR